MCSLALATGVSVCFAGRRSIIRTFLCMNFYKGARCTDVAVARLVVERFLGWPLMIRAHLVVSVADVAAVRSERPERDSRCSVAACCCLNLLKRQSPPSLIPEEASALLGKDFRICGAVFLEEPDCVVDTILIFCFSNLISCIIFCCSRFF